MVAASHAQQILPQLLTNDSIKEFSDAEENLSYPGDLCCNLYDDGNYGGTVKKFCLGSKTSGDTTWSMDDYNFHDKMSSWWCGKNVSYDFCRLRTGGSCSNDDGTSGAGNVRVSDVGNNHNDAMDRLIMRHYDASQTGAVTTFRDGGC